MSSRLSDGPSFLPAGKRSNLYHKLNFRAGTLATPDIQFRANCTGAFAHSGQPPVVRLTVGRYRFVDSHSIISNSYAKGGSGVGDLGLYLRSGRMSKSVCDGFSGNSVSLILHRGLESFRFTNDCDGKGGSVIFRKLLSTSGQALRKLTSIHRASAKVVNAVPCFAQDFIGAIEHLFHHFANRILNGDVLGHALHPQRDALEPLQQRVVQFSRNSCAFTDAFVQSEVISLRELAYAGTIAYEKRVVRA